MPNYLPAVVDRILSSKTHNALLDTMQRELRIVGVGSFILLRLAPSGEPFYRWIVGPEALNPLVVDENSSFRCSQAAALAVNIVLRILTQRRFVPNVVDTRLALALCSIQRRSDLVRLGRQHIRDGLLTVTQQKTGNPAYVEIGADLETAFMPSQHFTFLVTSAGAPFTPNGLTHYFRLRCKDAGLSGCPLHGLRKAGARLAVEAGCDITEVAAIGGWKSVRELQRYIEDYNRQLAARRAGAKMRTFTRTQDDQSRTRAKNA